MSVKGSGRGSYQCQGFRGGRGRGTTARGYSYSVASTKHKGLCSALVSKGMSFFLNSGQILALFVIN